jgi:hypothetical protein
LDNERGDKGDKGDEGGGRACGGDVFCMQMARICAEVMSRGLSAVAAAGSAPATATAMKDAMDHFRTSSEIGAANGAEPGADEKANEDSLPEGVPGRLSPIECGGGVAADVVCEVAESGSADERDAMSTNGAGRLPGTVPGLLGDVRVGDVLRLPGTEAGEASRGCGVCVCGDGLKPAAPNMSRSCASCSAGDSLMASGPRCATCVKPNGLPMANSCGVFTGLLRRPPNNPPPALCMRSP